MASRRPQTAKTSEIVEIVETFETASVCTRLLSYFWILFWN